MVYSSSNTGVEFFIHLQLRGFHLQSNYCSRFRATQRQRNGHRFGFSFVGMFGVAYYVLNNHTHTFLCRHDEIQPPRGCDSNANLSLLRWSLIVLFRVMFLWFC